jgi:hypothetical protein
LGESDGANQPSLFHALNCVDRNFSDDAPPTLNPRGNSMLEETANDQAATGNANGLSRRQMVKAGAWAAPAVVIAMATPSASASPFTLSITAFNAVVGTGVNHRVYTLTATVKNNSLTTSATANVVFGLSNQPAGNSGQPSSWTGKDQSGAIAANGSLTFTATFNAGGGNAVPTAASVSVSATGFTGASAEDSNFGS